MKRYKKMMVAFLALAVLLGLLIIGCRNNSNNDEESNGITSSTIKDGVYGFLTIIDGAVYKCDKTASGTVTIPSGVTTISSYAFYNCNSLSSVEIPVSVTSIGSNAFQGCYNLSNVNFAGTITDWVKMDSANTCISPNILTIDGNLASEITEISENDFCEVMNITPYTFYRWDWLKSVEIPEGVTSIGDYAFSDCDNLTSIKIPSSVTHIGYKAFDGCYGIENVNFTGTISDWIKMDLTNKSIGTIYDVGELYTATNITIGGKLANEITEIHESDFLGTSHVNSYTFYEWSGLESVEMPEGITSIGAYAFYNCNSLSSVKIPSGVCIINNYAFFSCPLSSLIIPNTVTHIGYSAFAACGLKSSLVIPSSVCYIHDDAFRGNAFESVTMKGSTPPKRINRNNMAFDGDTVMYVPKGSASSYKYYYGECEIIEY